MYLFLIYFHLYICCLLSNGLHFCDKFYGNSKTFIFILFPAQVKTIKVRYWERERKSERNRTGRKWQTDRGRQTYRVKNERGQTHQSKRASHRLDSSLPWWHIIIYRAVWARALELAWWYNISYASIQVHICVKWKLTGKPLNCRYVGVLWSQNQDVVSETSQEERMIVIWEENTVISGKTETGGISNRLVYIW